MDIARASFHQKGAERHRWRALVAGNSLVGLTKHASGDVQAGVASADSAQAMADHTDKRRDSLSQHQDAAIPCALHRIAALRFAMVCPRDSQKEAEHEVLPYRGSSRCRRSSRKCN